MASTIEQIEGKYLNNLNNIEHNPLSKSEEYKIFKLYNETHDIKYRNIIWNANLKYVVTVANQYYTDEIARADLISEGNLGLLYAISLFDYESGIKFYTYAKFWIRKYIIEYIKKYKKCINGPSTKTFDDLNVTFMPLHCKSLFDNNATNIDIIEDSNSINPDDKYNQITLSKLFNCLSEKEILYIELYFGLNGRNKLTMIEIANLYGEGKSTQRIQQIIDEGKKKLKNYLLNKNLLDIIYQS